MKIRSGVQSGGVERRAARRNYYLILLALGECAPGQGIGRCEWAWRFGTDVFVVRRGEVSSSSRGWLALIRLKSPGPSEYRLARRWRVVSSLNLWARLGLSTSCELRSWSNSSPMSYKEWNIWVRALRARRHERREVSSGFTLAGVTE
ncbi:MAG: hypothetical protein UY71_C0009G0023 [Parcubacteria group bacterium GW2011_GWB1_52_7]|nr:MAG: hypothetical protein UY64_C0004G0019 [Parcubacteria group bacterium GW2011_GWA1_51_12]KKW28863.1 MAG: hypothetical protein UY71_C0009G0023 [Parcubacteria group bacterium GW2011_GWB1_52_7]